MYGVNYVGFVLDGVYVSELRLNKTQQEMRDSTRDERFNESQQELRGSTRERGSTRVNES